MTDEPVGDRPNPVNPNWVKAKPEVEYVDLITGERRMMDEEELRADFFVPRFWDKKRIWVLNRALGYRRYL
jgi:hypothetical protein